MKDLDFQVCAKCSFSADTMKLSTKHRSGGHILKITKFSWGLNLVLLVTSD